MFYNHKRLRDCVKELEKGIKVEWQGGESVYSESLKKEVMTLPFPVYPDVVWDTINLCVKGWDYDYLSKIDSIKEKDISILSADEIGTYFTYIARGERFCDGHIGGYLHDGTFLALAKELLSYAEEGQIMNSEIWVLKRDITTLDTDAIVNAANSSLAAGGGVCGAIFKAAGYEKLQAACDKIGGCKVGSAVITPGFDLKAKFIIHAVGPRYTDGNYTEEHALESCYKEALKLAKENGIHSIAFPVISSGIFGYPKKEAFTIAIKTVAQFQADNSDYKLDVIFAVRDSEMFTLGTNVLEGVNKENPAAKDDFVFFWKLSHSNEEFSNWYQSDFIIEGISYSCVEQYMMAKKALMFKDLEIYACIMNSADPHQIKSLGKLVKNFKSDVWDSAKDQVVYNACYAKFSQNEALKKLLIGTGNKTLVEASPEDHIWGIGLAKDDPDACNPAKWQGENRLGRILAEVRKALIDLDDK